MRERLALLAYRYLPDGFKQWLGGSRVLRGLRDSLLRDGERERIATGMVEFEYLRFQFTAPFRGLAKAQSTGIENRICRALLANVPESGVCIDVGTNCGYLTLVMAMRVGSLGRVFSFEPNPFFYDIAARNIEQNGLAVWTTLHRTPVGRNAGAASLLLDDGQSVNVDFTTLTTCVAKHNLTRVDAIKIDVDGGDFAVLLGGDSVIRKHRPLLIVEMADHQQEIFAYLRDIGYRHIVGMSGEAVTEANLPANILAWDQEIRIPARGACRR